MIDHTGVGVSDMAKSKRFYAAALGAIGYKLLAEFPASVTGSVDVVGYGEPPKPDFWINSGQPNKPPIHTAFRVATRQIVRDFYTAALGAGGRDNGAPGLRPLSPRLLRRICAGSGRTQHRNSVSHARMM